MWGVSGSHGWDWRVTGNNSELHQCHLSLLSCMLPTEVVEDVGVQSGQRIAKDLRVDTLMLPRS